MPDGYTAPNLATTMPNLHGMATELRRATLRGYLPRSMADACLVVAIYRAARLGEIDADPRILLQASRRILQKGV